MTREQRQCLQRISAGIKPMKTNNPSGRAMLKRLEREGFIAWKPTGHVLTDAGQAAIQ